MDFETKYKKLKLKITKESSTFQPQDWRYLCFLKLPPEMRTIIFEDLINKNKQYKAAYLMHFRQTFEVEFLSKTLQEAVSKSCQEARDNLILSKELLDEL